MDFEIFSLKKIKRRPFWSASGEFDKDAVGPDDVDCLHKTAADEKIEQQIWTTGQLPKIRVLDLLLSEKTGKFFSYPISAFHNKKATNLFLIH